MPINYRQNIKINPVDLPENERTAVGITFPFNNNGVFFQSYTTKEQVKRLIFEQDVDQSQLKIRIEEGIDEFIPEIELIELEIKKDPNSHILNIVISYRLLLDYDTDAIQLTFN